MVKIRIAFMVESIVWPVSSVGRAYALCSRGCRFKSRKGQFIISPDTVGDILDLMAARPRPRPRQLPVSEITQKPLEIIS